MKTTPNHGFRKPDGTDLVNIEDFNYNADKLDGILVPVTTTANGLMTKEDKTKLNGIATGANKYTHPTTHPPSIIAQDANNKFVTDAEKAAWNGKANASHKHTKSQITDFPTSLPANGGNADTVDGKHASDFVLKNADITVENAYPNLALSNTKGHKARFIADNNMLWLEGWTGGSITSRMRFDMTNGRLYIGSADYDIRGEIDALKNTRGIKSVQRGTYSCATTSGNIATKTISISSVNTSKAFVLLHIREDAYTGYIESFSLSATSISLKVSVKSGSTMPITWQVIESY